MNYKRYSYEIMNKNGQEIVKGRYPIIIFNENPLPPGAIFIDFCASANFFEDIDENLSKWFWQFTICVGCNCSENSGLIIHYAKQLKTLLLNNKNHVQTVIDERYDNNEAKLIFGWWIDTLDIMLDTAEKRKVSSWKGIQNFAG